MWSFRKFRNNWHNVLLKNNLKHLGFTFIYLTIRIGLVGLGLFLFFLLQFSSVMIWISHRKVSRIRGKKHFFCTLLNYTYTQKFTFRISECAQFGVHWESWRWGVNSLFTKSFKPNRYLYSSKYNDLSVLHIHILIITILISWIQPYESLMIMPDWYAFLKMKVRCCFFFPSSI